jgi:dolichol kinase
MTFRKQIVRKSIHFLGAFYLPLYVLAGRSLVLKIILLLLILSALIELLRRRYRIVPHWILDPYEVRGVGAYVYFGVAALLLTAFLSVQAAIVGVIIGSIGDGVSGLVKAYLREKEIQSRVLPSFLMFLSSFLFLLLVSTSDFLGLVLKLNPFFLALTCLFGSFIESKPLKFGSFHVNDNLYVPLSSGIFYQLLSFLPLEIEGVVVLL